ncbi:BTAD domain-containing putative transcriptional regulator [Nocardia sp. NPDC020380]|uniref:BTAD domain-containing putative transcriptional regulator n=1 Tax=Nocardia sp. NPDC020380 TaxID=3364309 RepID=UPI003796C6C8
MTGAELRVLGPLQLSVAGREVALGTPMQRNVLGRLIVAHGQVVTTERLIDDLWSGQPPPKAASVLQVHIHTLRRLFEPDRPRRAPSRFIVSKSSGYALKIAEKAVDAWHFEEQLRSYQELLGNPETRPDPLARNALLDAALTQWRGPALEAFAEADWAAPEADRLTDLYLTAVELNAQTELELGRPGEVVLELRQLVEDHPGREGIVRLLALAQYRLGQQLEALTTIRRSREFLGAEFGVDPGPALRTLEVAILNHSADLTPAGGPSRIPIELITATHATADGAQAGTEKTSSTGYSSQLSELLDIAETARRGRLRLAWITGPPGIGKTTLTEAALTTLATTGWTTAAGSCSEIDGAPTAWAWSELLAELDDTDLTAIPTGGDAFAISRAVTEQCRRATASGQVALLLEDVHRADTATLQVLRQVANWLRDEPVLILITVRRCEGGPAVADTAAALARYTATWVELSGLDAMATRQAAMAAGLTTIGDELLAQLHTRTGGNPLFVRELAKLAAARGGGREPLPLEEVPDSIRELVDNRIAQLPTGVTEVLRHASIWGAEVELGILSLASGIAEDALIDLIAAAEAAGLVTTGSTGSIRFQHELLRDAVYLGIPALRRGRMHWTALELLEQHADAHPAVARDPDVLAWHAIRGASSETARRALGYVRAAAERRMARQLRSATVRLLQAAVDLHELAGDGAEHADRADRLAFFEVRCLLVTALAYDNRHREARAQRRLALDLADRLNDDDLRTRALTSWRAPVIWAIREWRNPDHRIRRALAQALARHGAPDWTLPLLTAYPGAPDLPAHNLLAARHTLQAAAPSLTAAERISIHARDAAWSHDSATPHEAITTRASTMPGNTVAARDSASIHDTHTAWDSAALQDQAAGGSAAPHVSGVGRDSVSAAGGDSVAARDSAAARGSVAERDSAAERGSVAARDAVPAIGAAGGGDDDAVLVRLLVTATFETGLVESGLGHRLAELALGLARRVGDAELLCAAIDAMAYLQHQYGDEFAGLTVELERTAARAGLAEYQALAHYLAYRAAVAEADLREAGRRVALAVEYADEGQLQQLLDMVSCFAATMELLRGDVGVAARLYEQFAARAIAAGNPNQADSELFCAAAVAWSRGDLSVLLDRLAEGYAALPAAWAQAYTLALLHAGDRERARSVFESADPIRTGLYPVLMAALRAVAAVELGDTAEMRVLYDYLAPHTGTVIGIETGITEFGPMDTVLAALAEALGDAAAATVHHERARLLLERVRSELPAARDALLRAA